MDQLPETKGDGKEMNRSVIDVIVGSASLLLVGVGPLAGVTGLSQFATAAETPKQQPSKDLTIDVAVDCRTIISGQGRGAVFIISGKIFPAGTLPSGTAFNDPTQPLNGVRSIGEFLGRGQYTLPLPPSVAPFYSSAIGDGSTHYFIFENGRTALTAEGYGFPEGGLPKEVLLAVTGGIGGFRGASGDIRGVRLGTNVTGCPNFRTSINLLPGSSRGSSADRVDTSDSR
jgi:hypothetical protein